MRVKCHFGNNVDSGKIFNPQVLGHSPADRAIDFMQRANMSDLPVSARSAVSSCQYNPKKFSYKLSTSILVEESER